MGTWATVQIASDDSLRASQQAAASFRAFAFVDSLLSNWTETSEMAWVNRVANDSTVTVSDHFATVLDEALRVHRESRGAFDVTVEPLVRLWGFLGGKKPAIPPDDEIRRVLARVGRDRIRWDGEARALRLEPTAPELPVHIDFGGIAKGYGVDLAARALAVAGSTDALVDLSGNMLALGRPPEREHWSIGIRDPRDRVAYCARVALPPGSAISTSGQYEQFIAQDGRRLGHILDPRTGWPAEGLESVTVLAPSAMTADAWSTALFVLGPSAARETAARDTSLSAVLVTPDTVWVESSLLPRVSLTSDGARYFILRPF